MRLAVISFTQRGSRLNAAVGKALTLQGYECDCWAMEKYAGENNLCPLTVPLKEWTGRMFREKEGILFIGAAGIAVRSIAPFVENKTKDPAIVVMDEKGMFAISLLSGHLGGANELTGALANLTGALPVITTATDVNGRFAVDVFAKKNHLSISSMKYAKEISADVLDEKPVGFYSEFPVLGQIPGEIIPWDEQQVFEGTNGICVTLGEKKQLYKQTLYLYPRIVVLGVGCKKGTGADVIERKVLEALDEAGISMKCVRAVASIDLKKQEQGILDFAEKYGLEFTVFSAEELKKAEGDFMESSFVKSVTGISNVCERSAICASKGRLLLKKTAGEGVTVAAAADDYYVDFE